MSDTDIMKTPKFGGDSSSLSDSSIIPFKDAPDGPRREQPPRAAESPLQASAHAPAPTGQRAGAPDVTGRHRSVSVIGESLHFKGELSAGEDLIIEGTVEGKINQGKCCLTLKPSGQLLASVNATKIFIEGKVKGDLRATVSVTVRESGHVNGNIIAPKVALEEGATFNGTIEMRDPSSRKPSK